MVTYGFSVQGTSHIKKYIDCQDAHIIGDLDGNWKLLAVADGVGSAIYSDIGSKTAVITILEYCQIHFENKMNKNQYMDVLKQGYHKAFNQIEKICMNSNNQIEDYDTTLTTVLYNGEYLIYGHAGDGGIIIKDKQWKNKMITEPQKGEDGISVRPLRAGEDSWDFGIVNERVVAVLLATDGMLNAMLPPLLNLNRNKDNTRMVYNTLADFFMNPYCVYKNKQIKAGDKFMYQFLLGKIEVKTFNACLQNGYEKILSKRDANKICQSIEKYNYSTWEIEKVEDDKTIVCAIETKARVRITDVEYFIEPQWEKLQEQFERLAYPSLFQEEKRIQKEEAKKEILIPKNKKIKEVKKKIKIGSMKEKIFVFNIRIRASTIIFCVVMSGILMCVILLIFIFLL